MTLAELACRKTADKDARCLNTLAAAYAEAGRFDDAVRTAARAEALAAATRDDSLLADTQTHLRFYRAGKPWHDPLPFHQPAELGAADP